MYVRVTEHSMQEMLQNLQYFLPKWMTKELNLLKHGPQVYSWSTLWGLIRYDLIMDNFVYEQPVLDLIDTEFAFGAEPISEENFMEVRFPALKEWKIDFDVETKPFDLGVKSHM
jgi:hypothetical protein